MSTETSSAGSQSPVDERNGIPEGNDTGESLKGLSEDSGKGNNREAASQSETGDANASRQNREARYRVERNEARAERDELAERLTQLQTLEVHRLAREYLAAPEDIDLSGKALSDYLTPEGWVDPDAVAEAAALVIESRPGLAKNPKEPAVDFTQGHTGKPGNSQPSWVDLLKA